MPVTAVVGANWGDEGKGKIVDFLAEHSDVVVRFQGGSNAGHTVINNYGKFALHLLPSGIFYPHVQNVLGHGIALDIEGFFSELKDVVDRGVPAPKIAVSDRAQVLLPYHIVFDRLEEERLGKRQYGSTRSGIAPFYADKYAKIGVQVADLYHRERLCARIERALEQKNVLMRHLYGKEEIDGAEIVDTLSLLGEKLKSYVADTGKLIREAISVDKTVLLEGQLGALRDPDHGIYPYSTSSSTLAGFAAVGAGVPPYKITEIIAVVKAYSTCVGAGPFVTELFGDEGNMLRERGGSAGEYGAKTGRPRRVGWFDAVATRYGCEVQGATCLALTNLDVLGYLDEIPVCTHYMVDGRLTRDFPVPAELDQAKPVYSSVPGWKKDIRDARSIKDLPLEARKYVEFIEKETGVPVKYISVGPRREETIIVN